jgi:hypothetical protein
VLQGPTFLKKKAINEFVQSPEGLELAAICLDCGYRLAEHPADLTRDQILFLTAALAYRLQRVEGERLAAEGVTRIVVSED